MITVEQFAAQGRPAHGKASIVVQESFRLWVDNKTRRELLIIELRKASARRVRDLDHLHAVQIAAHLEIPLLSHDPHFQDGENI